MKGIGENWLDCRMVYNSITGEKSKNMPPKVAELYDEYANRHGNEIKYNIWYDELNPKVFGADDTYKNSLVPNEASFLDSRENFLSNERYGIPSIKSYQSFRTPTANIKADPDGFFEQTPEMKKFENSTILIAGGGPSTKYCNWEGYDYDYLWSCNHFYKNQKLLEEKVDLFYINAETHMGIPLLSEYVHKNETICAADTSITRPANILASFKRNRCSTMLFNMRLFLSSGAAPKLVALAALARAKKILVVGMDGWTREQIETSQAGDHAFEKGKRLKISANYTYDFQRRETVVFWDYYLNFSDYKPEFQNIGETYKHNMSAEISKKMFPLKI